MAEQLEADEKLVRRTRMPGPIFFIAVLIALAILLSLGQWQVQRLHWKQDLLATIDQRVGGEPSDLETLLQQWREGGDVEYVPITVSGSYQHEGEQQLLATYNGQSGWHLYTPLVTRDGQTIIVNRGFVPFDLKAAADRSWPRLEEPVTIIGLARNPLSAKPGWLVPENDPGGNTWYWKDFQTMSETMGLDQSNLVPFFVDVQTANPEQSPGPIGGVTRIELPNNHLQYAVTWFGLAAVLVVTASILVWRGWRGKPDDE